MSKSALDTIAGILGGGRGRARDMVQDLWGVGFTIMRRARDPLNVDPQIVPTGMAYQWVPAGDLEHFKTNLHWSEVPASRHEGLFAPVGDAGSIESGGLVLVEKTKAEVDADLASKAADAYQQQLDDWKAKTRALGFTGHVRVQGQTQDGVGPEKRTDVDADPVAGQFTPIPKDLLPFMGELFAERDRIMSTMTVGAEREMEYKNAAMAEAVRIVTQRRKDEANGPSIPPSDA